MNESILKDIETKISNVDTHLCSKYYFENINDKACAFCKGTGKQTTCFGMRMFCPFEEGVYSRGVEEISKNELKTKISSVLENEMQMECEHYLQGDKYCLWCGAHVGCNGDRKKCESSSEKRMEELMMKAMT